MHGGNGYAPHGCVLYPVSVSVAAVSLHVSFSLHMCVSVHACVCSCVSICMMDLSFELWALSLELLKGTFNSVWLWTSGEWQLSAQISVCVCVSELGSLKVCLL